MVSIGPTAHFHSYGSYGSYGKHPGHPGLETCTFLWGLEEVGGRGGSLINCCICLYRGAPDTPQTVVGKPSWWFPFDFLGKSERSERVTASKSLQQGMESFTMLSRGYPVLQNFVLESSSMMLKFLQFLAMYEEREISNSDVSNEFAVVVFLFTCYGDRRGA